MSTLYRLTIYAVLLVAVVSPIQLIPLIDGVVQISWLGVYFLVCALGCIVFSHVEKLWNICAFSWLLLDFFGGLICYQKFCRTLSGITGERAQKWGGRWETDEKIIDLITSPFDHKPFHCRRAFRWEEKTFSGLLGSGL